MAGGGNGTDRHSESASGVPPFGNPFRSAGTCSTDTVAHSEIALFGAKPSGTVAAGRSWRQPELKCFLRASTRVKIRPQLAHCGIPPIEPCAYRDAATTPELRRAFWPT